MKVHSPYPKPTRRCDSRAAGNVRYDVGPRARSVRTVRLGSALLLVSRRLGTRRTTDEQWDEKCDAASTFSLSSDNRTVGRQSLEIEQPAHSAPWSSGNIDEPPVRSPVSRAQNVEDRLSGCVLVQGPSGRAVLGTSVGCRRACSSAGCLPDWPLHRFLGHYEFMLWVPDREDRTRCFSDDFFGHAAHHQMSGKAVTMRSHDD